MLAFSKYDINSFDITSDYFTIKRYNSTPGLNSSVLVNLTTTINKNTL